VKPDYSLRSEQYLNECSLVKPFLNESQLPFAYPASSKPGQQPYGGVSPGAIPFEQDMNSQIQSKQREKQN